MIRHIESHAMRRSRLTVPLRILVPAHNESARIVPMLSDYCERFEQTAVIMVIANACSDDTVGIVRGLMERYANLELMEINARIGKGGAIRAGLKTGDEPYIGFADADGSTSAEEFDRLFNACIQRSVDGVIGSRWLPGAVVKPRQPATRRLASRAFNLFVRLLFALPFVDTQCGAKVFRREAVRRVLPSLEVADFSFDIDLLLNLWRCGLRIAEIPTTWSDSAAGTKVRLVRTSLTMFKAVLRLRLQESLLWRLPFAEFFARDSIIPVKDAIRILFIAPERADDWTLECISALRRNGCIVQGSETIARSRLKLLTWYIFKSKRQYDAIVEVASSAPALIPVFSAKRTFVLERDGLGTVYRKFYGRSHVLEFRNGSMTARSELYGTQQLTDASPQAAAQYIVEQIGAGSFYRAAFHQIGSEWELRFNDLDSGSCVLQDLR